MTARPNLGHSLMIDSKQVLHEDLKRLIIQKSEGLSKQYTGFSQGLDELSSLLSKYDPAPSPTLNVIDLKGQDLATYFYAPYSNTHDFDRSLLIYKTIKSLIRYIILMDRFFEVGSKRYEKIARALVKNITFSSNGYMKYSIKSALDQIWPFWSFEQLVKKRMMEGKTFTTSELRHFNLFKASDAPLIYGRILESELESFNPNVSAILHYNQALLDIYDDFQDIDEDVRDGMPNIFILATLADIPLTKITRNRSHSRKLIVSNGIPSSVISIIKQYDKLVQGISIPTDFLTLKHLSRDYSSSLLLTLNAMVEEKG